MKIETEPPKFSHEDAAFIEAVGAKFDELAAVFASGQWYYAAERAKETGAAFRTVKTIFEREMATRKYFDG